jgi:hypothetical protein
MNGAHVDFLAFLANILPSAYWQDAGVVITHVCGWQFGLKIGPYVR